MLASTQAATFVAANVGGLVRRFAADCRCGLAAVAPLSRVHTFHGTAPVAHAYAGRRLRISFLDTFDDQCDSMGA
eukprot:COSAG03_NODE_25150_length_267_cov_0.928571_1_plen_74_part_01